MATKRLSGRPVNEDSVETRSAFIESGRRFFSLHGYQGAAMSSIAKGAGYTPNALRHYFADKADLYVAVFADTVNDIYPKLVAHLYSETFEQAVQGSMSEMLKLAKEYPDHMDFQSRAPDEFRKHPELAERITVRDNFQEFFYASLIALGRRTGELGNLSDQTLNVFFRNTMQGWIYEGIYSRNLQDTTQSALIKLARHL